MAAVGNATGHPATSSTVAPSQQQQLPSQANPFFGGGGFSGQNPSSGGTGSSGSSGSGSSSLDANAIAANVDPAIVDITSSLGSNGTAAGTGMVITPGGQVLTNHHVIQGATYIGVQIAGTGKSYPATVIGSDPANDVALLQIEGVSNLKTITVSSSKVAPGDPIVAIGNALGRGGAPAVAAGTVTAVQQTITATDDTGANAETLTNLIQVDANVLPGDSGGPLVDASGKVIGMDTAASSSGRGFRFRGVSAQGFAIPIATAMSVVDQLRNSGGAPQTAAQTALLGVDIADASTSQGTTGALVVGVTPSTPAESAGIVAGDVIVGLGGKSVTSPSTLSTAVKAHKPGDRVSVAWVDQGGQQHSATVQLAGLSAPAA
jgi:S1-C subfamily serine protease